MDVEGAGGCDRLSHRGTPRKSNRFLTQWGKDRQIPGNSIRLDDQRSLEQALADLVDKYDHMPENNSEKPKLARMIQCLEDEVMRRNRSPLNEVEGDKDDVEC